MKKAFLIDFDGVLLKPCAAHNIVAQRCSTFTERKLKLLKHTPAFSSAIYKTYGHTVLAINAVSEKQLASKEEFNSYVYNNIDTSWFSDLSQEKHQTHKKDLLLLLHRIAYLNVPVYIFSNAPQSWCYSALRALDPIGELSYMLKMVDTGTYLKPEAEVYTHVKNELKVDKICFIDDNIINFQPIMHDDAWVKVWYNNECEEKIQIKEDLVITGSLLLL